ncbi:hypothetical protein MZK47_14185 [Microbacterium aerolatum]|jgi:hypothetical protein|uniref:hypothetical protein n=1 Tax=Microbacterium aerolatum TaxID=153731 RepID=UPI0020012610|nr:hypothetical protein [Microbacterium aerolatum]MCK3770826.1 hypothetical protein [Microbacterium aerolatum]
MSAEFRQALTERRDRIEARTDALLDAALAEHHRWADALGAPPKQPRAVAAWRQAAHTVTAYRDRYGITDASPLGAPTEDDAQKIDAARARAALDRARTLADTGRTQPERPRRATTRPLGPRL